VLITTAYPPLPRRLARAARRGKQIGGHHKEGARGDLLKDSVPEALALALGRSAAHAAPLAGLAPRRANRPELVDAVS